MRKPFLFLATRAHLLRKQAGATPPLAAPAEPLAATVPATPAPLVPPTTPTPPRPPVSEEPVEPPHVSARERLRRSVSHTLGRTLARLFSAFHRTNTVG